MSAYELPLPCNHTHRDWKYRISSHTDEETANGVPSDGRYFCTLWVCWRDECVDRGKRYVAAAALCTPHVIEGTRSAGVSTGRREAS